MKNGTSGWYWEVLTPDRAVFGRGVTKSLEAARAEAEQLRHAAAKVIAGNMFDASPSSVRTRL
jgi:hypothetical protein